MRRVRARRFALAAAFSALAATSTALLEFNGSFLVRQSSPVFWFAALLFGIMLVLRDGGLFFFLFTEEPREVEILERSMPRNVIHLSDKQ